MSQQIDRRRADRRSSDEDLSPEYLALLAVCGGEIRASDRAVLAERRQGAPAEPEPEGAEGEATRALPAPDRRRAGAA
ncbi:MAG: hypothetical protein M3Z15_07090 [Pseudomonadota bacterium]|nr:hypothetical protein [Pseudomonadota bacterium]